MLNKLFAHESLTRSEAADVLTQIAHASCPPAQVAAFITVYLMRSVTVEELTGFRDALLDLCTPVELAERKAVDLCGTGGDGKNTFNISTCASIVVAGAGYPVAKHGNYGVSSTCGSSNVMHSLGYRFPTDPGDVLCQLDQFKFCFLHAPHFHPALKAVSEIRKTLGIKTFFNMLGPLVNPARPGHQLVGVFNLRLARLYQHMFEQSNSRYCIVHSLDGYDEVSLTGPCKMITPSGTSLVEPEQLGRPELEPQQISGGTDIEASSRILVDILSGQGTPAQEAVVLTNAALAIRCFDDQGRFEDCYAIAEESLHSGRAFTNLRQCIEFSQN